MQKNKGPQPQRFIQYTELKDGTGFTIDGCDHIFKYDENKGWEDQFGNYYNADGQPAPDSDYQSYDSKSWSDDEDEFQKKYGSDAKAQQQFQKQSSHSQVLQKIAHNITDLQHYQKDKPLRINYQIIDIQQGQTAPTPKQIYHAYKQKVKGILNVISDFQQQGQNHTGYFVVKDSQSAQKLIALQGKNLIGFDISFEVQTAEQLINDPLSSTQLQHNFQKFTHLAPDQHLYLLQLDSQTGGFHCSKNEFIEWLKQFALTKESIIKILSDDQKLQKKPVLKIKSTDLPKFASALFGDKKVIIEEYKPIHKKKKTYQEKQQSTQKIQQTKLEDTKPQQKAQQPKKQQAHEEQPQKDQSPSKQHHEQQTKIQ